MKHFEYVTKKEYGPVKEELINLIRMVQDDVREHFTSRYDFIGSASRNMITRELVAMLDMTLMSILESMIQTINTQLKRLEIFLRLLLINMGSCFHMTMPRTAKEF